MNLMASSRGRVIFIIHPLSFICSTRLHVVSDRENTPIESEPDFVNAALPLLDVFFLLLVLRHPEDKTRGITSGRRGQRPHSLVIWTVNGCKPDHRCQFSCKLVQALWRNQNGEVRDFRNTIWMLYTFGGDLEPPRLSTHKTRNPTPPPTGAGKW